MIYEKHYQVTEFPHGFTLTHRLWGAPLTVRTDGYRVWAEDHADYVLLDLYCYRVLCHDVASHFLNVWLQREAERNQNAFLRQWARRRIQAGIDQPIWNQLERLRQAAGDPLAVALQARAYQWLGRVPSLLCVRGLFEREDTRALLEPALHSRALMMTLQTLPDLLPEAYMPARLGAQPPLPKSWVAGLRDWQSLWAWEGVVTPAVAETLAAMPGRVPPDVIWGLRLLQLERPLTDRVQLIACAAYSREVRHRWEARHNDDRWHWLGLLLRSEPGVVRAALGKLLRPGQTLGGYRHILAATMRLLDTQANYDGQDLRVLADHILEAEAQRLAREFSIERVLGGLRPGTVLRLPLAPLPNDGRLRFIATAGEAAWMVIMLRSLIGGRLRDAALGDYFLFRIEYEGELAIGAVDGSGHAVECWGKHQETSAASEWGCRKLQRWSKQLRGMLEAREVRYDAEGLNMPD